MYLFLHFLVQITRHHLSDENFLVIYRAFCEVFDLQPALNILVFAYTIFFRRQFLKNLELCLKEKNCFFCL